jgi:hypothetical protein
LFWRSSKDKQALEEQSCITQTSGSPREVVAGSAGHVPPWRVFPKLRPPTTPFAVHLPGARIFHSLSKDKDSTSCHTAPWGVYDQKRKATPSPLESCSGIPSFKIFFIKVIEHILKKEKYLLKF